MKRAGKTLKSVSAASRWLTVAVIALALQGAWLGITCLCEQPVVQVAPSRKHGSVPAMQSETHCGAEREEPMTASDPSGTTPADALAIASPRIAAKCRHSCVACCLVDQRVEVYVTLNPPQKSIADEDLCVRAGILTGSPAFSTFHGLPPPPRSCPLYLVGSALLI